MTRSLRDAKASAEQDGDAMLGAVPNLDQGAVPAGTVSPGVRRIKAMVVVMTGADFALLCVGVLLVSYIRNLSALVMTPFQSAAISGWNAAQQTATISVVYSACAASSQPVWAKMMDYFGRPFVLYASFLFYVLGYVIMAVSQNVDTMCGGTALYVFGYGAQNLFLYIIIADATSLRHRLLFSSLVYLPNIINVWAAGVVGAKTLAKAGWRWGYGIQALVYPVALSPIMFLLGRLILRARRGGAIDDIPTTAALLKKRSMWRDILWKADVIGLFLLSSAIALCLIPLTLGGGTAEKWKTAPVLAPFLIGIVLVVPAFIFWETKAPYPMLPFALLRQRHILLSLLSGLLSTITGAQQSTYLYFALQVAFGQGVEGATRISKLATFSSSVTVVVLGFVIMYVRRPKPFAIAGAVLYTVAYALLYNFRGGHDRSTLGGLIAGEIVLGIGNGLNQNAVQVGLQAAVQHEHLAIITAMYFCTYQVGAALGAAITGAIWTNTMERKIRDALLSVNAPNAAMLAKQVYGNPLQFIVQYQPGSELRAAVDEAYRAEMRLLCISGLAFSAALVVTAFFIGNPLLTDKRSAEGDDICERLPAIHGSSPSSTEHGDKYAMEDVKVTHRARAWGGHGA